MNTNEEREFLDLWSRLPARARKAFLAMLKAFPDDPTKPMSNEALDEVGRCCGSLMAEALRQQPAPVSAA